MDAASGIYIGGWPYQTEKDSFENQEIWADNNLVIGEQAPRVQLVDQFGEMVDLYDFAGQGKYIIIDISAVWCGPCNDMSAYLNDSGGAYWEDVIPDLPTPSKPARSTGSPSSARTGKAAMPPTPPWRAGTTTTRIPTSRSWPMTAPTPT